MTICLECLYNMAHTSCDSKKELKVEIKLTNVPDDFVLFPMPGVITDLRSDLFFNKSDTATSYEAFELSLNKPFLLDLLGLSGKITPEDIEIVTRTKYQKMFSNEEV